MAGFGCSPRDSEPAGCRGLPGVLRDRGIRRLGHVHPRIQSAVGLENGALDCRSWSLPTLCPMEFSRIAPAGGRQRAALYRRPAPVHTALSCRRDRRVYSGCVQSTRRMVSGCDVRCRPHIRREVRPDLGAGVAQRKQLCRGSGRNACSRSKELGVDRCGYRRRRLLYCRARPRRTLRAGRRALKSDAGSEPDVVRYRQLVQQTIPGSFELHGWPPPAGQFAARLRPLPADVTTYHGAPGLMGSEPIQSSTTSSYLPPCASAMWHRRNDLDCFERQHELFYRR